MGIRAVAALALIALIGGCGSSPAACPVVPRPAPGQPFLWRVQDGKTHGPIVWLYGTIHDIGLDDVPPVALDRFDNAARFVSELGNLDPDPDKFRELVRMPPGKGIDQLLPADDWWELRDALLGVIKEDDLRRVRPWYAMSLFTTHLVPSPGPSMDQQLAARARGRAMPVVALETWEEQLSALNTAVGVDDLREAIHARRTMKCELARMQTSYEGGDLATMQHLLVIERTAETMLWTRNKKWLPTIESYLHDDLGAFVAVGLGHLLGDGGLPGLLARAGYDVERMP